MQDAFLQVNQRGADSRGKTNGLHLSPDPITRKRASMKTGGNAGLLRWRRFIVDVLIGAATLAVAVAAIGATAGVLYMLLILGVVVGIGLMLEPNVTRQPTVDATEMS